MEQFDGEAETIITLRGTNDTNSSYRSEKNENVQQKIFSKRNRKHFENNTKCYKNKTKCSQEEIVPKQIFNKNLLEQIQKFCSIPNCLELSRLFQKLIQNVLKLFYAFFQNFCNNKKSSKCRAKCSSISFPNF